VYRTASRPRSRRPWLYAALGVVVVATLGWVVLGTSLLGVRAVAVNGSEIAPPDRVREVAAVAPGTPLARVDTDAVAGRVRTLPSVRSVEVSRAWPHTLVIEITERVPAATASVGDRYLVLDNDGVVFRNVRRRPAGLPLIETARPGPDDGATRAALRVVRALTPELRDRLEAVVADSPARISLRLTDDRVIVWGDAEQSETKALVATSLLDRPGRTIDVSAPDVVTVS
jgi:cell division protein FtsQ